MNETLVSPGPEAPKKNNTVIIVAIVVILLCCCCVVVVGIGWQFGDQILKALGM
jgi:hypothetical protein